MFKDILLKHADTQEDYALADDAFEHLSGVIKLMDQEADSVLFNEGDEGELFYIVIEGEVEVLKAIQVPIVDPQANYQGMKMKAKCKAYYNYILEHY